MDFRKRIRNACALGNANLSIFQFPIGHRGSVRSYHGYEPRSRNDPVFGTEKDMDNVFSVGRFEQNGLQNILRPVLDPQENALGELVERSGKGDPVESARTEIRKPHPFGRAQIELYRVRSIDFPERRKRGRRNANRSGVLNIERAQVVVIEGVLRRIISGHVGHDCPVEQRGIRNIPYEVAFRGPEGGRRIQLKMPNIRIGQDFVDERLREILRGPVVQRCLEGFVDGDFSNADDETLSGKLNEIFSAGGGIRNSRKSQKISVRHFWERLRQRDGSSDGVPGLVIRNGEAHGVG